MVLSSPFKIRISENFLLRVEKEGDKARLILIDSKEESLPKDTNTLVRRTESGIEYVYLNENNNNDEINEAIFKTNISDFMKDVNGFYKGVRYPLIIDGKYLQGRYIKLNDNTYLYDLDNNPSNKSLGFIINNDTKWGEETNNINMLNFPFDGEVTFISSSVNNGSKMTWSKSECRGNEDYCQIDVKETKYKDYGFVFNERTFWIIILFLLAITIIIVILSYATKV